MHILYDISAQFEYFGKLLEYVDIWSRFLLLVHFHVCMLISAQWEQGFVQMVKMSIIEELNYAHNIFQMRAKSRFSVSSWHFSVLKVGDNLHTFV